MTNPIEAWREMPKPNLAYSHHVLDSSSPIGTRWVVETVYTQSSIDALRERLRDVAAALENHLNYSGATARLDLVDDARAILARLRQEGLV